MLQAGYGIRTWMFVDQNILILHVDQLKNSILVYQKEEEKKIDTQITNTFQKFTF